MKSVSTGLKEKVTVFCSNLLPMILLLFLGVSTKTWATHQNAPGSEGLELEEKELNDAIQRKIDLKK
jgi:hypothetical protein